ncbi:MAG: low molecular weight phosphotyrosine protein phosphatase [Myxococcales bacterium]|nr:low molecular weight phosphotyrosine protein phosphatase [Myxococcales bacterium]MCB9753900.1 low molecular weight phosphotyrosine protein phosphatase [Myxococcales bacterium]
MPKGPASSSSSLRGTRRTGVLFVCYANICRSPLAEGIFRELARQRGLDRDFTVDSAGVAAIVGAPPHAHSVAVARRNGITLTGKSRQLVRADLYRFQHILLLDRQVAALFDKLCGPSKARARGPVHDPRGATRLLATVSTPRARGAALDIRDPIGEPEDAFEQLYTQLDAHCLALLRALS